MPQTQNTWSYNGTSLFTHAGERKYLNPTERQAFYEAIPSLCNPRAETFCELIYWTGCRPSEALALLAGQIDRHEKVAIFRSLKKRSAKSEFRPVPLPSAFLKKVTKVHAATLPSSRLWNFGRTTAWKHVAQVMSAAGIYGERASARGLRHSLGVLAVLRNVPLTRIQRWLGHASLEVTAIYLDVAGPEDRALARRMWKT